MTTYFNRPTDMSKFLLPMLDDSTFVGNDGNPPRNAVYVEEGQAYSIAGEFSGGKLSKVLAIQDRAASAPAGTESFYADVSATSNSIGGYKNAVALGQQTLKEYLFRGDNEIQGSGGSDTLLGYGGNDKIYGAQLSAPVRPDGTRVDGNDVLIGGKGNDQLYGMVGDDILIGGNNLLDFFDGKDTLYGGLGNDTLWGAGGADTLFGQEGNDQLLGGYGNDVLYGGAGNDTYVMILNGGQDVVADFQSTDIISIERTATVRDFASLMSQAIGDQNGSYFNLGNGNGVTVAYQLSAFQADDFFFFGG